MKKILFISHNASRSGAPFVLLYLLQWLKENSTYEIDVLLLSGGPLESDFKKVSKNYYFLPDLLQEQSLANRIKTRLKYKQSLLDKTKTTNKKIQYLQYQIVYGNTIVSLPWLINISNLYGVKTIGAIHELKYSLEAHIPQEYLTENLPKLDLIIAGSHSVANNLKKSFHIPDAKLKVVHAFVNPPKPSSQNRDLLSQYSIEQHSFIIGCAGYAEWRKGTDLVVPLAMYLNKIHPAFQFHIVWIGANFNDIFVKQLLFDIEKRDLKNRITILENKKDYIDYINLFDVFAMMSREDPFPLVSLEAAYLQKPIVMFSDTGGTIELLLNGGGKAVPYLDIEQYGDAIVGYANNNQERMNDGKTLKHEVEANYKLEITCNKVLDILKSFDN